MTTETIVMELVVKGGNARSKAMLAIQAAREKDFEKASALMEECRKSLLSVHQVQTELIQEELNGGGENKMSLIMIHGQDHLMNAITVQDLAEQMIEMYRIMYKIEKDSLGFKNEARKGDEGL